jgi:hypothetical protein
VSTSITRRGFLAGGAGLVLAACGSGKNKADIKVATTVKPADTLNVVLGSQQFLAGADERVSFIVFKGQTPTVIPGIEVGFASADGAYGQGTPAELHNDGIENRPYYLVRHTFAAPGFYKLGVNVGGGSAEAALQAVDASKILTPVQGRPMPSTPTPTVANTLGIDPICTRQPACPWHDVSLDAALAEKRPLAVLIASPARCQTQTCGPVLDILLSQKAAFESKVRFVHVEVYKSLTSQDTIPAVDALHLESEPWLFLVGADGVVRERYDGPFDRKEAIDGLTRLTA